MIEPQARRYLESAIDALVRSNYAQANRDLGYATEEWRSNYAQANPDLGYATEEWPSQCDLHRAVAYTRFAQEGGHSTPAEIAAIRQSLDTFDEIVGAIDPSKVELTFTTTWTLPLMPVHLPLVTRGQVRAAHAAALVEAGEYDQARAELDAAARERVVRPDNAAMTAAVISTVDCLLHYRTARWEDLVNLSSPLVSASTGSEDTDRVFAALGNAFGGAALAHMSSHDAGQTKLRNAISSAIVAVAAWSSLQLGLSHRTAGDEDAAQKVFASGLQYTALPELIEASRNRNIKLRISAPDVIAARTSYWDPNSEPDITDYQRQSSQDDRREVLDAHERLTGWLGDEPTAFAYPNGNGDPRAHAVLAGAGYRAAFAFDHHLSDGPAPDRWAVSRLRVNAWTPPVRFRLIMSGLHPALLATRARLRPG